MPVIKIKDNGVWKEISGGTGASVNIEEAKEYTDEAVNALGENVAYIDEKDNEIIYLVDLDLLARLVGGDV